MKLVHSSLTVRYVLLALVGLVPLVRPATAVTKTPFTVILIFTGIVSPGTEWVTPNTLHVKDEVDVGIVTGDLTGTITAVVNRDLNLKNDSGCGQRGGFTLTTATVTWVGTYTDCGQTGKGGSNIVVGHGSDGSQMFGNLFGQPDGTILVQGVITTP